uniref:Variant surface glycoprotein 1546 n=1 Tax=Trypanosoma brucei TaxID=5691 RepID=M4TBW0_9TRYP|nr:variant surface glycoprotein 1546 [Trypanosoma brucei]
MNVFVTWVLLVALAGVYARGQKAKECTTLCGCAARIRRRLAAVKNELDGDVRAHEKNKNDMMKLLVAAITADDDTKRKVAPVLAAAGKTVATCDIELKAATETYDKALKLTEQLAAIYSVQHLISSGKENIHLTLATSNPRMAGGGYKGVFTLGQLGTTGCKNDTSEDSVAAALTEDGENAEDKPPKLITHVNIVGNCQRDNTASNACDTGNNLAGQGQIKIAMTFDKAAGVTTDTWADGEAAPAILGSNAMDMIGDIGNHAHYEIKTLDAQIKSHNCRKDIRTYSAVASETVYKLLLTKTTEGKEEAESGDELSGSELNTVVSQRYGNGGQGSKANLWDAVDNSPAYLGKGKTEETTQVKKLKHWTK